MKYLVETVLFLVVNFNYHSGKELPSFIKKCKRADPELNKCVMQRIEELRPHLIEGIPEMKFPPIEPLHIPKLELETGKGSSTAFRVVFTDILVHGVKDFQVKEYDVDFPKLDVHLRFYFPDIQAVGRYSLNGKILLFEVNANGVGRLNITGVDAKAQRKFTIVEKNGKHHGHLADEFTYDIKYEKASVYFENLFGNNQQLTEETNKALNENFEEVAKEVNPLVYEAMIALFSDRIENFFREYALEDVYD